MGILADAAAIFFGCLIGSIAKIRISDGCMRIFGIAVAIMSIVGFAENTFVIEDGAIGSRGIYVVVFSLLLGYLISEWVKPERFLSQRRAGQSTAHSGFIDAAIFFGVGGLQISGPILLALAGDSSQLYLKAVIDLPFALMYGAIYGRRTALSALPVAAIQLAIALIAYALGGAIGESMVGVICSLGFIILFFSGVNMFSDGRSKINNTGMIFSIPIAIAAELLLAAVG